MKRCLSCSAGLFAEEAYVCSACLKVAAPVLPAVLATLALVAMSLVGCAHARSPYRWAHEVPLPTPAHDLRHCGDEIAVGENCWYCRDDARERRAAREYIGVESTRCLNRGYAVRLPNREAK